MEIWLLIWCFSGLLALHFMWSIRDMQDTGNGEIAYVRSLIFGILLGPIGLLVSLYRYKRSKK